MFLLFHHCEMPTFLFFYFLVFLFSWHARCEHVDDMPTSGASVSETSSVKLRLGRSVLFSLLRYMLQSKVNKAS